MQALENRTLDSKREMDVLDALQDIRARNARNERVAQAGGADLLDKLARAEVEEEEEMAKRLEDEEDEKLVREVFSRVNAAGPGPSTLAKLHSSTGDEEEEGESKSVTVIKRKADGEEPELHKLLSDNAKSLLNRSGPPVKKQKSNLANSLGIKVVKKGKAPAKSIS